MAQDPVLVDVRQLSSGTVAMLCGRPDYETIDAYRLRFMAFVEQHPGKYKTWYDAWHAWPGH